VVGYRGRPLEVVGSGLRERVSERGSQREGLREIPVSRFHHRVTDDVVTATR